VPNTYNLAAEPRELIDYAVEWLERGDSIAMLTLVNIEGNAPYPVGSQMLVNQHGEYLGQITGGCAEAALALQAKSAIALGQNTVERYGLNSPYFDIQLPCGSGVDIHFSVSTSLPEYQKIKASLARRKSVDSAIEFNDQVVQKRYLPNERLIIVGKGPIVRSLQDIAQLSGFDVVHLVDASIEDYCDEYTALVSLFHEHELEIEILAAALSSELFYIGALGSQKTHQARLKELADKGFVGSELARIYGPVGADIGAVSPAQIAISIMSEIIEIMNSND